MSSVEDNSCGYVIRRSSYWLGILLLTHTDEIAADPMSSGRVRK